MDSNSKPEKIEKTAFKLFLKNGYSETGVREICCKAGVEAPTLYHYFGSKKGLFFHIAARLLDKFFGMNNYLSELTVNE